MKDRFKRQFLLTKSPLFPLEWKKMTVDEYVLYYHPKLDCARSKNDTHEIILLGMLYDWEFPEMSNQEIVDYLINAASFSAFLKKLAKYAGQYTLIYKSKSEFLVMSDAVGQSEVYYDTSFSVVGSQPKLLGEVIPLKSHTSSKAAGFYGSDQFLDKRLFVGETTHLENVKRILPNYLIDLNTKEVRRYFPYEALDRISIEEAAAKAAVMLKGYIKAVRERSPIAMALTGGYDSRVLFFASLDIKCNRFVIKHQFMSDKHYDLVIPQKLARKYEKPFDIIPELEEVADISSSCDFPRKIYKTAKTYDGHIYINGNISEIARNMYSDFKNLSPADLAYLSGYKDSDFVVEQYEKWHSNLGVFEQNGYHLGDMLYWEDKIGIRGAKEKTMSNQLDQPFFTPYCSHDLLTILLSTEQKFRDRYVGELSRLMILELHPDALELPINPCLKLDIIRLMTRLKIYGPYRRFMLKFRLM